MGRKSQRIAATAKQVLDKAPELKEFISRGFHEVSGGELKRRSGEERSLREAEGRKRI